MARAPARAAGSGGRAAEPAAPPLAAGRSDAVRPRAWLRPPARCRRLSIGRAAAPLRGFLADLLAAELSAPARRHLAGHHSLFRAFVGHQQRGEQAHPGVARDGQGQRAGGHRAAGPSRRQPAAQPHPRRRQFPAGRKHRAQAAGAGDRGRRSQRPCLRKRPVVGAPPVLPVGSARCGERLAGKDAPAGAPVARGGHPQPVRHAELDAAVLRRAAADRACARASACHLVPRSRDARARRRRVRAVSHALCRAARRQPRRDPGGLSRQRRLHRHRRSRAGQGFAAADRQRPVLRVRAGGRAFRDAADAPLAGHGADGCRLRPRADELCRPVVVHPGRHRAVDRSSIRRGCSSRAARRGAFPPSAST